MKNLRISYYKALRDTTPTSVITMSFSVLHISANLLPTKVKAILRKEGIDIMECKELVKEKSLEGTIIEIQNVSEKVIISVEQS